ncbi:hypothetical protein [Massilia sp. TWR1-2-2]|uniref:hypothetical protein n=1 Tax=Massilia sp. TWR1-2-2 TaxID=2804584 RepID=UPI003CE97F75
MGKITVELEENAAKSAQEIATLQHVLPSDVANCAVMIGLEILRAEQFKQNGLVQKFIRSQQSHAISRSQEAPQPDPQEAKKRAIMDGFGIWKELATAPKEGLQYQQEARSEWN